MRRKIIACVAAATIAVGLLGACARPGSDAAAGPLVGEPAQEYERMLDDIWGTRQDRLIAEKLVHHRMQEAIKGCMATAGHPYNPPAYQGLGGTARMAIGDLDGSAPIGDSWGIADGKLQVAAGVQATRVAGGNPAGLASGAAGDAYTKAMDSCQNAGAKWTHASYPVGALDQAQLLENVLVEIAGTDEAKRLQAAYVDCLNGKGYQVKAWVDLHELAVNRFPTARLGVDELKAHPEFIAAAAFEKQAAAADATCRADLYAYTTQAVGPHLQKMRQEGGRALAEVVDGWAAIREEALQAGIK